MSTGSPIALSLPERYWRFLRLALFCLIVMSLFLLSGGLVFPLGNNPLFSFMMFGPAIIHLSGRPGRTEAALTLLLALLFHTAYGMCFGFRSYFGSWWINWGGFAGCASLLVMFVQYARSRGERRRRCWRVFLIAGTLPYAWIVIALALGNITYIPRTYDAQLLAFDSTFGFQPSFALARLLYGHPALKEFTRTVYNALPLGGSCLLAWYSRSAFRPVRILPLYITMMVVGYLLYGLFPAAGPACAYRAIYPQDAPHHAELLAPAAPPLDTPRNAMPSLHFGAMLVLVWNSRQWKFPARAAAWLFLFAIAFSTLALGEHYLIDLVVALPFVMMVQAVWTTTVTVQNRCRCQAILAGALGTAAWLSALRWAVPFFLAAPPLAWCAVLATVAGVVYLQHQLSAQYSETQRDAIPGTARGEPEPCFAET